MNIPNNALQKLKCDYGNHYLSQFPVYLTSDHKNVCGRCGNDSENSQRNVLYETLAAFVEFPCMFTEQGCTEVALPNKIEEHELNCSFKSRKCPMDGVIECKWQGTGMKIVQHCHAVHSDFILENMQFIVDLSAFLNECRLVSMGSLLYTLNLKYYSITNLLELSLMKINIGSNRSEQDYRECQIVLETDNRHLTIDYDIEQTGRIEILLDSIRVSKDVTKILGSLVFNKQNNTVLKLDYRMLEHFKCGVCKKYALPPYHTDNSRVIQCHECDSTQDSYANQDVGIKHDSMYYLLENIAENIVFPCINGNGCKFASVPNEMKTHLISCPYGIHKCPVSNNCNWNDFGTLLAHHIGEIHQDKIKQSTIMTVNLEQLYGRSSSVSKTYFHKFSNRFFRIRFFERSQKYFWDIQETGTSHSEFSFRIEIKNDVKRLTFEAVCSPIRQTQDIIKRKKVFVTREHLEEFIVSNTITFQFSIDKK